MRILVSPQARTDLDSLWLYIARESGSHDRATRTVAAIAARFGLFARHPNIGRIFASVANSAIRTFPVGNYRIFYLADAKEIRILRVIHSSRDIEAIFASD